MVVLWKFNCCGLIWYVILLKATGIFYNFIACILQYKHINLPVIMLQHRRTEISTEYCQACIACHTPTNYKKLQYCVTLSQSISWSRHSTPTKNIRSTNLLHILPATSIPILTDPVKSLRTNSFNFNFTIIIPFTHNTHN